MKPHEEALRESDICVMALLKQISEKEVMKMEDGLYKIHWHDSVMVILNLHVP
jgi:hypothetical protein